MYFFLGLAAALAVAVVVWLVMPLLLAPLVVLAAVLDSVLTGRDRLDLGPLRRQQPLPHGRAARPRTVDAHELPAEHPRVALVSAA